MVWNSVGHFRLSEPMPARVCGWRDCRPVLWLLGRVSAAGDLLPMVGDRKLARRWLPVILQFGLIEARDQRLMQFCCFYWICIDLSHGTLCRDGAGLGEIHLVIIDGPTDFYGGRFVVMSRSFPVRF